MAKGKSYKYNGLELTVGNKKLANDTMIFNMGSGTDCPSRKLGFCKLGNKCYALKAERLYPQCKPYRDRQQAYWLENSVQIIWEDTYKLLTQKKKRVDGKLVPLAKTIKWFRFNEAGDFHSQSCIWKLSWIAERLNKVFNITTYGYSARADLDFSNVHFNVKSSGHNNGNNGRTIAHKKADIYQSISRDHKDRPMTMYNKQIYMVCQANCKTCDMCKTSAGLNIVFPLH